MNARLRLLALFVVVPAVAAILQPGGFRGQAQAGTCGAVKPNVLQGLTTDSEVSVIISLRGPPGLQDDVDLSEVEANTLKRQAAVLADLGPADFTLTYQYMIAPALAGRLAVSGSNALDCHPDVESVHLDGVLSTSLVESVPLIHGNDPQILLEGLDGTGVDIAVIDSGIDGEHPDLLDNIIGEECFIDCPNGTDRQSGPGSARDDRGHGTHVSGIITSNGSVAPVGVAPNADIFAYKTQNAEGDGSVSLWLAALDHILYYHGGQFEFINMSLELEIGLPPPQCQLMFGAGPLQTVRYLRDGGTLILAASGNNVRKDSLAYPACIFDVVSVGGVYDADIGEAWWKPGGEVLLCSDATTAPDKVICFSDSAGGPGGLDLLAPGSEILSTYPTNLSIGHCSDEPVDGTEVCSGTSQAAPHAVGVGALLKDALPGLTPDEVVNRLKSTGTWVKDDFNDGDPATYRWTPRVDARVALLGQDNQDYDLDGCTNGQEFGPNELLGGRRNPLNFWDFYDTPDQNNVRDGAVSTVDVFRVAARFGAEGDPNDDPLAGPIPDPPAYHPAFDRGPSLGPNSWNLSPADGAITTMDTFRAAAQFGHEC